MRDRTYTDEQRFTLVDLYLRDHRRATPWPVIAQAIDAPDVTDTALERLLWGIVTGYTPPHDDGPRRPAPVRPAGAATKRKSTTWQEREDNLLKHALGGAGQRREPPVDARYIAAVLARTEAEVVVRWGMLTADPLGRGAGFGFGE